MPSPDQTDTILTRNQVLQPLVGAGSVQWYQIITLDTSPSYKVSLTSTVTFQYSHSPTGPWKTLPAGAMALELSISDQETNFYIMLTGTLELLTD